MKPPWRAWLRSRSIAGGGTGVGAGVGGGLGLGEGEIVGFGLGLGEAVSEALGDGSDASPPPQAVASPRQMSSTGTIRMHPW